MSPQVQEWAKTIARSFVATPGKVLEIGALNVNGTVRQFFTDAVHYIGTDMEAGDNVDMVINNNKLLTYFGKSRFNTIIACSVFEHDINFWRTVRQLHELLAPGGYLIITTPTIFFPYHGYPHDYWRFTKDAYIDVFFAGMEVLDLRHLDNQAGKDLVLAGIAKKAEL